MHPKYIKSCRVCGSTELQSIVDLGEQFLQGSFVKEGWIEPPRRKLPTKLVRCDVTASEAACGLVQLAHTFPPEVLYANYWYRSGTNQTMRDHLTEIVQSSLEILPARKEALAVLDIGCNDGTLLRQYPDGTKRFGVDPSDISTSIDFPVTLVSSVFPSDRARAVIGDEKFDVITSIAMFYDLEDPVEFAREIASMMRPDGMWILEISYLPLMLQQNSFDTICHEHLEYYSLTVLEEILKRAGLRTFKAQINDINGGSIRLYACHSSHVGFDNKEDDAFINRLRLREFELALDTPEPYARFLERIEELRTETRSLVMALRYQGKRIQVYGASTKGNVLLQWYGFDSTVIDAAAERNAFKVGARTLGTDIPIISEEESRKSAPDCYLVLPWHFRREFLEREAETIRAGATFLFPLPQLELVDASNLDTALEKSRSEGQITMLEILEAEVT